MTVKELAEELLREFPHDLQVRVPRYDEECEICGHHNRYEDPVPRKTNVGDTPHETHEGLEDGQDFVVL